MQPQYLDLKAIPQAEMLQSDVLAMMMQTLHGALPRYAGRIGIAFPAYGQNRSLGGILRLFGSEADLKTLHSYLQGTTLPDYALLGHIEKVPQDKVFAHARFTRRQKKGGSDLRRAEKRLKEQGLSAQDIQNRLTAKAAKIGTQHLPHVHLRSASTGQRFILAIHRQQAPHASTGLFNSYGLSQSGTTVPLF